MGSLTHATANKSHSGSHGGDSRPQRGSRGTASSGDTGTVNMRLKPMEVRLITIEVP